jgi:soluble lytic murein transglycosylase-like protein
MPYRSTYISNETLRDIISKKNIAIKKYSRKFNIQQALIKAIIKKESRDFMFAFRIDYSVLRKQFWYKKTLTVMQRKYKECWASYGYMQVLFGLARSYGYKGTCMGLFDIDTNIYYGCKHLEYLRKRYKGNIPDIIHAYNWGSNAWMDYDHDGIKDPGEPYKNQKYVDEVLRYFEEFGGKL